MSNLLQLEKATLEYSDHERKVYACREIDLHVKNGEFLGILGPSGSGKSSLLYLLSGLKQPTGGKVLFHEKDLAGMNDQKRSELRLSEFGFVFQQPYLLGYLTALENVLIGQSVASDQAWDLLDRLHLAAKAHRLPHELSGGERQRVCVARALFGNPKVIFADEPTASLDHVNGREVVALLNQHRQDGALVMVTHDPAMLEAADRIVNIEDGQVKSASEALSR